MRFKAGDRVTVNNPAYDLHHGISGVVKEYFTEGRNAGRYSVDPDNQVLNDGEFCSMFFIDEKFLVGEKDNVLVNLSVKAMSLRQEAAESKADASNLRNRAIRQDAHAALCISDAEALEKAAAVLDKTRSS